MSVRDNVLEQMVCNVIVTFRLAIVGKIKTEQLSNLPTEKIVFEF